MRPMRLSSGELLPDHEPPVQIADMYVIRYPAQRFSDLMVYRHYYDIKRPSQMSDELVWMSLERLQEFASLPELAIAAPPPVRKSFWSQQLAPDPAQAYVVVPLEQAFLKTLRENHQHVQIAFTPTRNPSRITLPDEPKYREAAHIMTDWYYYTKSRYPNIYQENYQDAIGVIMEKVNECSPLVHSEIYNRNKIINGAAPVHDVEDLTGEAD